MGCTESRVPAGAVPLPPHATARDARRFSGAAYGLVPRTAELPDYAALLAPDGTVVDADVDPKPYRSRPDAKSTPRAVVFADEGLASADAIPPTTLIAALRRAAQAHPEAHALVVERAGHTKHWTWSDYLHESTTIGKSLVAMGVQPFEGVMLYGFNSPEWFMGAVGAMMAGAIPAGIYPTDTSAHVVYKTNKSGARVMFVDHEAKIDTLLDPATLAQMPRLELIVTFDNAALKFHERERGSGVADAKKPVHVLTWAEFLLKGTGDAAHLAQALEARRRTAETCAVYIFTSGTTGLPKPVMLTHDNLNWEARVINRLVPGGFGQAGQERYVSYLPLSHVAALMVDLVSPIFVTADSDKAWGTTFFATEDDLKGARFVELMRRVRPTVFLGMPRVWDKMAERVHDSIAERSAVDKWAASVAMAQSLQFETNLQLGGSGAVPLLYDASEHHFLRRVKETLGLDACKMAGSGAAPISTKTLQFFASLGVPIYEVYGASETTGIVTMTRPGAELWGSIGCAIPGCEVKVLKPGTNEEVPHAKDLSAPTDEEKGELCVRGRNIMLGYAEAFDGSDAAAVAAKNAETFTADGWCRTGDIGCRDARGMFRCVGRYKELIKTRNGEIVAPVPVEEALLARAPALSRVVVVGDRRDYVVALVTLQQEGANGLEPGTGKLAGLARDVSPTATTVEEAVNDVAWETYLLDAVKAVNADAVACPSKASRIKKVAILPRDFSVATDEMTPTLKVRRAQVEARHAATLELMFAAKTADAVFLNSGEVAFIKASWEKV